MGNDMTEIIPTFFIPYSEDREEAESAWQSVKAFMERQGFRVKDRRIYAMAYSHNKKACYDRVGGRDRYGMEEILVLLDAYAVYLCCTPNRGVVRGEPILTGLEGTHVVEFAPDNR